MAYTKKATPLKMQKTATPRMQKTATPFKMKKTATPRTGSNPSTPNVGGGSGVSSRAKRKIY